MEDHDDLMPVFAAQSDLLSATYGEFFLADMIELQDNENKVSQLFDLLPPRHIRTASQQRGKCRNRTVCRKPSRRRCSANLVPS